MRALGFCASGLKLLEDVILLCFRIKCFIPDNPGAIWTIIDFILFLLLAKVDDKLYRKYPVTAHAYLTMDRNNAKAVLLSDDIGELCVKLIRDCAAFNLNALCIELSYLILDTAELCLNFVR